jgi:hypothetical protein
MPNSDRSALAEYLAGPRLPHARRFDLDEIAELEPDKNPLGLTHMIPSKDKFKEECGESVAQAQGHGDAERIELMVTMTRCEPG